MIIDLVWEPGVEDVIPEGPELVVFGLCRIGSEKRAFVL